MLTLTHGRFAFCSIFLAFMFSPIACAREFLAADHEGLFSAKGFFCEFSGGLDFGLNDAFAFKSTPARPQSFRIIVHNLSVRSGTALFGSDQKTALDQASVSNLGGAISFFVEYGRGVTVMTIFAKKSPSNGKFYAAFTEQFLSPLISDPNAYIVTGTCSADPT